MSKSFGFTTFENCCRGPIGPPGDIGTQGYTGLTGNDGSRGSTITGNTGNIGAVGGSNPGFTGFTGVTGVTGNTGVIGAYGATIDSFSTTLGLTGATASANDFVRIFSGVSTSTNATVRKLNSTPSFDWAVKIHGNSLLSTCSPKGIVSDVYGNNYVTGDYQGTITFFSFQNSGNITITGSGSQTGFVAKIDTTGQWQWASQVISNAGGTTALSLRGITLDSSDCVYVTGSISNTAGLVYTFGTFTVTFTNRDPFIAKLNSNGEWQWVVKADLTSAASGNSTNKISSDIDDNILITGTYFGTLSFGTFTITAAALSDIFVAKLDSNTKDWLWARTVNGGNNNFGYDVCSDKLGNSYISGNISSVSVMFGNLLRSGPGLYVAKLDTYGNFIWASIANGPSATNGIAAASVIVDENSNVYTTGFFRTTVTFGDIVLSPNSNTNRDKIFIAKLNSYGEWQWATTSYGDDSFVNLSIVGRSIAVDCVGNSYITGSFQTTITLGNTTISSIYSGQNASFFTKLDTNGNYIWALQNDQHDVGLFIFMEGGFGISSDNLENIYVTGIITSTTTFGSITVTAISNINNGYVTKIRNKDLTINPKGVLSTNANPGDSVKTSFFNGMIVAGFTGLSPGYQYYLDNNANLTINNINNTCQPVGISVSETELIGN